MARDDSDPLQVAIITRMEGHAPLLALTPRIYPPEAPDSPQWPFVLYGSDVVVPFVASCIDGSEVTLAIHSFAKTSEADGGGQAYAKAMSRCIAALFGGEQGRGSLLRLEGLPYSATAAVNWTGSSCFRDGSDAGAWHAVTNLRARITS